MIDILKAKQEFKNYVEKFDLENGGIKLKLRHTYQVADASYEIATRIGLSQEQIELAEVIGLLHDIGRFEQYTKFDCFSDTNFDHAEFGVEVLKKDDFLTKFVEDKKYHDIILKAIKNHNKYKIEEGLDEQTLLQAKLIRDSDKLDNFYVKTYESFEVLFKKEDISYETISDEIFEEFKKHKTILNSNRKTSMDAWVSFIAFIFDINFLQTFKMIYENNYINRLVDRIDYKNEDTKRKMEVIRNEANRYIIEHIK